MAAATKDAKDAEAKVTGTMAVHGRDAMFLDEKRPGSSDRDTVDATEGESTAEPTTERGPDPAAEPEYISGLKLFTVMTVITLAAFLMLLDMSIIVTVSLPITARIHPMRLSDVVSD